MSKKILLSLLILTTLLSCEELTFGEKASASFLKGIIDGVTGIGKNLVDLNISKKLSDIEKLEDVKSKNQSNEIKRLKKSINSLSAERYKYIHLYSQSKDQNRVLKKRVAKLEKLIKEYHIQENNKNIKRSQAKEDLKKQLKGESKWEK